MPDSLFKRKNLKNVKPGDIFAFRMEDGRYGFGRIVSPILEGHVAEIFNHFADEAKLDPQGSFGRFMPPVILNSYGMFQVKQDGDWGIIGSTPNYSPDAELKKVRFAYGPRRDQKAIDIDDRSVSISDAEAQTLPRRTPFNDWFVKRYIEPALKGEIWPKTGIV